MPKSSMTTLTPRSRSASSVAIVEGVALSSAVSVISRLSRAAAMPASARASWTASTKPGCWISRAETLTHRKVSGSTLDQPLGLAARFAQHPPADRQDRAVLLGDLDELARGHEAALGMLPANERFDPGEDTIAQIHDGLVHEPQLAKLDGVLELDTQLVAIADRGVHAGIEDRVPGLAVRLGHVHRHVGVADDVVGGVSVASRALAMPMLAVTLTLRSLMTYGSPQLARQSFGHGEGALEVGCVVGQDRELVAAEAGDEVVRREPRRRSAR